MPTYHLTAIVIVMARTTVDAETINKAYEIAAGREKILDPQGKNDGSDVWVIESADGDIIDVQGPDDTGDAG